jgi:hypothetical protein
VATPPVGIWEKEHVPDGDHLFMRAHRTFIRNGVLTHGVFKDHGGGMSTDWERYSTPAETRARAAKPAENGIIMMVAGSVRSIDRLIVEHTPKDTNRSHTDVIGEKTTEVRFKLQRIAEWAFAVNDPMVSVEFANEGMKRLRVCKILQLAVEADFPCAMANLNSDIIADKWQPI